MKKRKRERQREKYKKFFVYFLIVIFLSFIIFFLISAIKLKVKEVDIPELSLEDFVKVDIEVNGQNILLSAQCYRLAMITGLGQTESISRSLENITALRPNAHDLFVYTLKNFKIPLLFVKIPSLISGTYYAKLFFKQGNNILVLDSRPSDAIAIALRLGSPIYVKKELFNYAEKIC